MDGYGTLLELDNPFDRLLMLLAQKGIVADAGVVMAAFRAEMAYYRDHHLEANTDSRLRELRLRCADVLFGELNKHGVSQTLGREDQYTVLMAAIQFRAFQDWREATTACQRGGLKVGIVSNWDCSLPEQLNTCGIDPGEFSVIVTSAVVGVCKPDALVFDCALKSLEVDPGAVLHVGDDPEADAMGARRAGMHGILLDRNGTHPSYDGRRISCLSEVEGCIREIDSLSMA
jgi:HAD superfamily hydrolase (TIGR01549 family)